MTQSNKKFNREIVPEVEPELEPEPETTVYNDVIIIPVSENGQTTRYLCLDSDKFTKITGLSLGNNRSTGDGDTFSKNSDNSQVDISSYNNLGA